MRRLPTFASLPVLAVAACRPQSDHALDFGPDTETGGVATTSADPVGTTTSAGADGSADEGTIFDVPATFDVGGGAPHIVGCDELAGQPSMLGCEFWAHALTFWMDHGSGIGVANPWPVAVEIVIEDGHGPNGTPNELTAFVLEPRESRIVQISGTMGIAPHAGPYRVTSDRPITAMQVSPLGAAVSMFPEASSLLPTHTLGQSYILMGYGMNGMLAVIATQDDTTVTTPDGDIVLDAFEIAYPPVPADPTGVVVTGDKPFVAFSGSTCAYVPEEFGWCDHLEEQLLPASAWGTEYVGARHPHRMPDVHPEPDAVTWRVIAAKDDTTVTLVPPVDGVAQLELAAGQFAELTTPDSFVATAAPDRPFMLVQYMRGGTTVAGDITDHEIDPPATGDPWMLQMIPVAQWLTTLSFSTDTSYQRDFVTIVRTVGTTVELECLGVVPDDHFTAIPGTDYEVGHVDLDTDHDGGEGDCHDGSQFLAADAPVGISVGGIDCAASYGFPGAGALAELWDPGVPAG